MSNNILEVSSLCKSYRSGDGEIEVLKSLSFTLPASSSCALVGPSGSGKSTLLGLCAGLDSPSSGSVLVEGVAIENLNEDQRARLRNEKLGFVFQSFHLLPTLTALENVMVPAELRGRADAKEEASRLLSEVGLSKRTHHYPSQLSGGEQQRVAIARAYINRPKILFADEPTGNLDSETAALVEKLLFSLNSAEGTSLLIATHNLDLAEKTNRQITLKGGQIVADELQR